MPIKFCSEAYFDCGCKSSEIERVKKQDVYPITKTQEEEYEYEIF